MVTWEGEAGGGHLSERELLARVTRATPHPDAQLLIGRLPSKSRRQAFRSINQLEQDPFSGDYRIIFAVHPAERLVDVGWVLLR